MKSKRIVSLILVLVIVFAMAATACGKKEEAAEKEEPNQEETSDTDEAEADDEDDAEAADEEATKTKDTNKTKLTEEDIEALKTSIAETVIKEYLEPNGVAAEDFSWPSIESSVAGEYLSALKRNYLAGLTEEQEITMKPGSPDKEIIDALFNGAITWYEASGVDNFDYLYDMLSILQNEVITSIDVASYK